VTEVLEDERQPAPPRRVRIMGRTLNAAVARFPAAWPLLRPLARRFFDREAPTWGDRVDRSSAEYLAPLAAGLLHVQPEPERALDLGTGTGDAALLLAREFPQARVRGVDISEEMIRRAQARIGLDPEGRVAFRVADAAALPYDDSSFDLVAQLNMPPFYEETARVLRPGGTFVIAASWGEATPFYTPEPVLRRGFERSGLEKVTDGGAAAGTYFVARRPA
jgi:SAM-dependent methyltransferase